ncbi:DUF6010 family protein [Streptomyces prasinopilosus]|uniref:Uncharacterized protein n=1 Tax=Streptomyces prasinopilosus TaxID=67344 RepID=A0A1G6WGX7_9ACTN|nr:DUF6010 family protein [Streptomyces prasinopilosus]SDD64335.1 hypothetical protein SAMN05216505_11061 [Streptomyces prasinopilosus]
MHYVVPVAIGVLYALLMSFVREPHRRRLNAVVLAGAGAAYLSGGGLGGWEFAFTALITYVAFRGLDSWTFIGVGWLLHTAWDVVHHLEGGPIIPFAPTSSLGCAICDPVIALWCLLGGPSLIGLVRRRGRGDRSGAAESAPAAAGESAGPAERPDTGTPAPSARSI